MSIQPLTDDQIERYLQSAKGQLETLRHALQDDPELYELARRPLMLSIFMLAYQGATPEDLPTERTGEAQQRQVFTTFVERMLLRRSAQSRYSQEHIQHWLAWLARQMQQHHMTEFSLEQLQPTWLPTKRLQQVCTLPIRLVAGLSGLAFGLGLGLLFGQSTGLVVGLGGGLVFGLTTAALVDTARTPGGRKKIPSSSSVSPLRWSCTYLHEDRKSAHLMHRGAGRLVVRRPVIPSAHQS